MTYYDDDDEVLRYMHEIECAASGMESFWEGVTVESLARELVEERQVPSPFAYDDILEMCDEYLQRYSDPFYGIGGVHCDFRLLTESDKNALLKTVTAKSKLLKEHVAELDAYVKDKFGDSLMNQTE